MTTENDDTHIVLSHKMTERFMESDLDEVAASFVFDRAHTIYLNEIKSIKDTKRFLWEEIYETYPELDAKNTYKAEYNIKERRFVVSKLNDK